MRGKVTDEIRAKAKLLLGIDDISTTELRLMPYVQFVMVNNQKIEPNKINQEERDILSKWRKLGWIEGGAAEMSISKEFWDAIHELLWLGYVTE